MTPCTDSTCPRCGYSWSGPTYWSGDSSNTYTITAAPTLGTSCYGGTGLSSEPVLLKWLQDPDKRFSWFRDFERVRETAARVPALLLAARMWRRLRGADAAQVRRQKRRCFVQALAGATA